MSCRVAAGSKMHWTSYRRNKASQQARTGESSRRTGRKTAKATRAMRKREERKRKRVPVAGTQMRCRLVGSNQKKHQRACRGRVGGGGGGEERGLTACEERSRREKAVAGQREERSATRCKSAEQQGRASGRGRGRGQRAQGRGQAQRARRRRKSGPGYPPVWCWASAIIAVVQSTWP